MNQVFITIRTTGRREHVLHEFDVRVQDDHADTGLKSVMAAPDLLDLPHRMIFEKLVAKCEGAADILEAAARNDSPVYLSDDHTLDTTALKEVFPGVPAPGV